MTRDEATSLATRIGQYWPRGLQTEIWEKRLRRYDYELAVKALDVMADNLRHPPVIADFPSTTAPPPSTTSNATTAAAQGGPASTTTADTAHGAPDASATPQTTTATSTTPTTATATQPSHATAQPAHPCDRHTNASRQNPPGSERPNDGPHQLHDPRGRRMTDTPETREITPLVDGVNAYRVAEFEVSNFFLKELLQMPAEALVLAVRAGDSPHGDTFIVKVADPALPLCPVNEPPRITPIITKERVTWDWNVQ